MHTVKDYLNANDILSPCQSGFRQNHSTMSSLLSNSDSWLVNMDAGLVNGVVFLDLRKEGPEGGGSQSHFPPEILAKSQSQLDFYYKSQSELLKSQS
jgi:hypothetical protein